MRFIQSLYLLFLFCSLAFTSCRDDELVMPTEYELTYEYGREDSEIEGMYLLNEGAMGQNKSTLDYLDFRYGLYTRNLFAARNPYVVKEMGDVGNDIQIYGSKLYAVINCSHKVDVLSADSAKKIRQINIPNCRYIRFYRNYAYVSSYAGKIGMDPNAPLGTVYKVDTTTLEIVDKVTVGYQPDELEVLGQYLYVANSGGYRSPNYDHTISVIELERFKQVDIIDFGAIGLNLHRIKADRYNKLWVSSRGNYNNQSSDNPYGPVSSNLFVLEKKVGYNDMEITDTLNIPCTNMTIHGDSLYLYSTEWDSQSQENQVSYAIINIKTKEIVSRNFITDGTESDIEVPYGINIHPETGDIYITDAKNFVSSGTLYCYNRYGKRKWEVRTGDIPAHMTFLRKKGIKK